MREKKGERKKEIEIFSADSSFYIKKKNWLKDEEYSF